MQENTNIVAAHTAELNTHRQKSKILKVNSTITTSVTLDVKAIEEVNHFTYQGSVVGTQGGTEADIKARIGKARVASLQLMSIWKSNILSLEKHDQYFQ